MFAIEPGALSVRDISYSWQGVEWCHAPGGVVVITDGPDTVRLTQKGTRIILDCTSDEFWSKWYRFLGIDMEQGETYDALARVGGVVSKCVKAHPGLRIARRDPFEALMFGALVDWNGGDYYKAVNGLNSVRRLAGPIKRVSMGDVGKVKRRVFPEPRQILASQWKMDMLVGGEVAPYAIELCHDVADGWVNPTDLSGAREAAPYVGELAIDLATLYRDGGLPYIPHHKEARSFLRARYGVDADIWPEWYIPGFESLSGLVYQHVICYIMEGGQWASSTI